MRTVYRIFGINGIGKANEKDGSARSRLLDVLLHVDFKGTVYRMGRFPLNKEEKAEARELF